MEFSDWSVIAEVVSAVGIIITLAYLAVQVHQNTRQLKQQGIQMLRQDFLANLDQITKTPADAHIFSKGLNQFNKLTAAEKGAFHTQIHSLLHGWHSIWEAHKAKMVSDQDAKSITDLFLAYLLTPGGKLWWSAFKHVPPPYLVEYLDVEIEKGDGVIIPVTETLPWLKEEDLDD